MDLIPSFAVDHTNLHPGIYISRRDQVGGEPVTTYDIRMTSPNQEPALAPAAIHTIEHLVEPICAPIRNGRIISSIGAPWDA